MPRDNEEKNAQQKPPGDARGFERAYYDPKKGSVPFNRNLGRAIAA